MGESVFERFLVGCLSVLLPTTSWKTELNLVLAHTCAGGGRGDGALRAGQEQKAAKAACQRGLGQAPCQSDAMAHHEIRVLRPQRYTSAGHRHRTVSWRELKLEGSSTQRAELMP